MHEFVNAMLMVQAAYRQVIQRKVREQGIDLSFEMLQVMRCLYFNTCVNQQELANLTYKDKSSLSYLLSNMEKKNLLKRVENSADKRSKLIVLTEEGQSLQKQIREIVDTENHRVEDVADKANLKFCAEYMTELSGIINNE